jgi:hypothetical protein
MERIICKLCGYHTDKMVNMETHLHNKGCSHLLEFDKSASNNVIQSFDMITEKSHFENEPFHSAIDSQNYVILNKHDYAKFKRKLQLYKNRDNEKLYHCLLMDHFDGKQLPLLGDVTDITTNDSHIEIKEWRFWKKAIGHLTCYNLEAPREKLLICCFGKYGASRKRNCQQKTDALGIELYEFIENELGEVCLVDLDGNVKVRFTIKTF